ncbi:centrosomal protein of 135 kDa [Melitaea cinxia]|uniref:centrosomal protein of 135 kDa n=1 Tax=Melitaea cinxia TaxID=113334 RepID=UPI001E26F9B2|nr:centrosomal protein of 135 kDa [Melitaea cinxia]
MGEAYFNLKRKLDELGYNSSLPVEAVPLVECIFADLLQTTRSLQHYMDLSKEALMQRDELMKEAEPYKCDNIKLIHENNQLHRDVIQLKEENLKITKESQRKLKTLSEEIAKKETLITKLQHDLRDLSLRSLCADTLSSRNKTKRKDGGDCYMSKICMCNEKNLSADKDVLELKKSIQSLLEKNNEYCDEIALLKNQIEHRDSEIIRLNILLEGGRPLAAVNNDFYTHKPDSKIEKLMRQINDLQNANDDMKKELEKSLEKQHEAMLRALSLADKNKALQEELQKVDKLALKVEDDCNKRLASMMNELNFMQTRIEGLTLKNSELERELSQRCLRNYSPHAQESLVIALKEKDALQKEIKDLVDLNKSLQDKILSLSEVNSNFTARLKINEDSPKCSVKDELKKLFADERKNYETYINDIQQKLTEALNLFNEKASKIDDAKTKTNIPPNNAFIKDLHNKLCESEQKILMLRKENDDLRNKALNQNDCNKHNYQDIISHLNAENAELSKENISLSQQLSQYRAINQASNIRGDSSKEEIQKFQAKIEEMKKEIQLLRKDKQEYNQRYKDALDLSDRLRRDLALKQRELENLEEENCSYKMTNRTGKASAEQLKDECNFLRKQIKKMQTDIIKEKTLASQIKNIQLETERSSTEIQNELLSTQKKLSLSKDTVDTLQKKCNDLQSEIINLKSDKLNLIDNIKSMDKDRDKLVIDLDNKTENISILEQKIKSQTFEISKLESEISELKRKLNFNKVNEHRVADYESQINFLNGEIKRISQQYDTAIIENKHLQNSLADVNGVLKLTKMELEKSKKDVEGLKQQLQHYVAEIRRIEDLLSQKEAERSDMLEQFASLSVEANILENNNHSLESESASKTIQLQTYVNQIQHLEEKLVEKDNIIDSQSARIASMTCKINALQNEMKLITEEKIILEQNVSYLKQMCGDLKSSNENNTISLKDTNSELKLYEDRIKNLSNIKSKLESEKEELRDNLMTTEKLLSNARKEIIELKLALQDATSETKSLNERVCSLTTQMESKIDENVLSREHLELPLMLEETIHELSNEDDDSGRYNLPHKNLTKYSHSSTL